MTDRLVEPSETDNIDCHLQQVGMGTLICRAATRDGQHHTNEVSPTMCFNCPAGAIYRDVGCSSVAPKIRVIRAMPRDMMQVDALFCLIRKRNTTLAQCRDCRLVAAETTRNIMTATRGLLQAQGFFTAYQEIEKLREAIREGDYDHAITRSVACLESVMRVCHENLNAELPGKKQITDLWRSTRALLRFDEMEAAEPIVQLLNSLGGVASSVGGVRNALGDAHGKGLYSPAVSEMFAELAANTAMTLATAIIRRYKQVEAGTDDNV